MNKKNVYGECPVYQAGAITLRQTTMEDAEELLKCYSDEKAVSFFNADNCPDNFYYNTLTQMREEITFWDGSYQRREFVRWTVIHNGTNEKIGTIEMFNRGVLEGIGSHGILRIDLRSNNENKQTVQSILKITNEHFHTDFDVKFIFTKAVPDAKERIAALMDMGYIPITDFNFPHYYARNIQLGIA